MLTPEQLIQLDNCKKQVNLGKYYQIQEKITDNAFSKYNCKKRLAKHMQNAKKLNASESKTIFLYNGSLVKEKDLTEEEKDRQIEFGFVNYK